MQEVKLNATDIKFKFISEGDLKFVALVADHTENKIGFYLIDAETSETDQSGDFLFDDYKVTLDQRMNKIIELLKEKLAGGLILEN